MKRITFLIAISLSVLYSCSKKTEPVPETIVITPPNPTNGASNGSSTTTRINIMTTGGNGGFDHKGILTDISISKIGSIMTTAIGTNTKVSLEHAENATITKIDNTWRATFTNYSETDTTNQPYIRAIYTNPTTKKITEYRGYIVGKTATLDYLSAKSALPATMDAIKFQNAFKSSNQQMITPKPN